MHISALSTVFENVKDWKHSACNETEAANGSIFTNRPNDR